MNLLVRSQAAATWPPLCGTTGTPLGPPTWWVVGLGLLLLVGLGAVAWKRRVLPGWAHGRGVAAVAFLCSIALIPHPVRLDVESNCSDESRERVVWVHFLFG